MRHAVIAAALLAVTASAQAQQKSSGANPATDGQTQLYNMVKGYILKAADQVPEDKYAYQPTKDVRTFGQLLGHIADAQATVCPSIKGEDKPYATVAEKLKTKAEIISALKATFATCDAVYSGVTDAGLAKSAKPFGMDMNVSGALTLNTSHNWEHYGNIVTYMRMLGMVPPSSQR